MHVRLVHLRSARAKYAVIMRIPSDMLPRHTVYFSDGSRTCWLRIIPSVPS